jgi:hypothetical protein
MVAAMAAPAQMQLPPAASNMPDPIVTGAPYAADSIVTVRLTAFGDAVTQQVEALGTKEIDGLPVTGQRTVSTLPAGGDGRPVEISDERWASRDLRVVIFARHRDSRAGEFEHRLANLNRSEPSAQLFTIPPNYTIVDAAAPAGR